MPVINPKVQTELAISRMTFVFQHETNVIAQLRCRQNVSQKYGTGAAPPQPPPRPHPAAAKVTHKPRKTNRAYCVACTIHALCAKIKQLSVHSNVMFTIGLNNSLSCTCSARTSQRILALTTKTIKRHDQKEFQNFQTF